MGQFKQFPLDKSTFEQLPPLQSARRDRFKYLWRRIDDDIQTEGHITNLNKKIRIKLLSLLYIKLSQMEWDTTAFQKKLSVFSEYKKSRHQKKVLKNLKLLSFKSFHDSCLYMLKPFASTTKKLKNFHITLLGTGGRYPFSHFLSLIAPRLEELWVDLCYTSFTSKNKNPLDSFFCSEIGKCVTLKYLKIVSQTQIKDNVRALLFKKIKKIKFMETLELLPSASFLSYFKSAYPLFGAYNHIKRIKVEFLNKQDFGFFLENIHRLHHLESMHITMMFLSFDGQLCTLGLMPNLKTLKIHFKEMQMDDQDAFQVISILTAFELESLKIAFQDVTFKMEEISYVAELLKFAPKLTGLSFKLKPSMEDTKKACILSEMARCMYEYANLRNLHLDLSSTRTQGSLEIVRKLNTLKQLKQLSMQLSLEFPTEMYTKENFELPQLDSLELTLVSTSGKNIKKALVLQNFRASLEGLEGVKNLKKFKLTLKFSHEVRKEDKRLLSALLYNFENMKEFTLNCHCSYFYGNEEEVRAMRKILRQLKYLDNFTLAGDNAELDQNLWYGLALCKKKILV